MTSDVREVMASIRMQMETEGEIEQIIRTSRTTEQAVQRAKAKMANIEEELRKSPSKLLEQKLAMYQSFVEKVEAGLRARPPLPKGEEAVIAYDREHTLKEIKEIARSKGLSTSGDKKAIIRRILG